MKLNKYSWLAVLPMIFTACQNDALVEDQQQGKIYTLSAKMDDNAAMSRAQIQLGNTDASAGEIFFWNEGDSFTLYQGENDNYTEHVFTIKDYSEEGEGDKKTAFFVTNNPVSPGEVIGVYPSGMPMDYDQEIMKVGMDFQTELDFGQGTVEEVWKDYFRNNLIMKAKATLSEGGNNTLQFEHLTSLARITYHNQSGQDQNVTEIVFGGDQTFGYSKTVWFKYDIIGGNSSNGYRINYKNLIVKAGESFDFYILFGPNDFREGDMHIHIHTAQTDVNRSPLALPTSTIAAANNNATKFEAGKRYWFKVTETSEGLVWTKDFSGDVVTIKNTELSQALYGVLGADKVSLNDDNYAVMNKADVDAVTALDFNAKGYTITSLSGIENFVNLDDLRCNSVGLVSCDLSKNKALKLLMLSSNPLEGVLDLSNNANLEVLYLQGTDKLTTVKLDNCTKLGFVCLTSTRSLTSFDIPNKAGVYFLDYSSSSLNFNLSEFTGLTTLKCSFKGLTELNLSDVAKSKLTFIECSGNNLGDLDLSGYTSLETFSGFNAGITSLNVSAAVNLKKLWCFQNNMQSLDITSLSNLEEVRCGKQLNDAVLQLYLTETQKTNWDTTWSSDASNTNVILKVQTLVTIQNTELSAALQAVLGEENVKLENGYAVMTKSFAESVVELNIESNMYTIHSMVGIEYFTNLKTLNCQFSGVEKCDLSKNTKLTNLMMGGNNLTSLDCSNNTELTGLMLENNKNLEKLDISGCSKLNTLILTNTKLSEIEVPNPGIIRQLNISRTSLKLSLNAFTDLSNLSCYSCGLTSIDLPTEAKQKLTTLICYSNNIKSLILSEYPNLSKLNCKENLIEELDITSLKNLKELRCGSQNNGIVLKLQMTASQKELWNSTWSTYAENQMNVDISGGSTSEPNTNGNNFWFEEL